MVLRKGLVVKRKGRAPVVLRVPAHILTPEVVKRLQEQFGAVPAEVTHMETEKEIRKFLSLSYDQQDYDCPGPRYERESKEAVDSFIRLCEDRTERAALRGKEK